MKGVSGRGFYWNPFFNRFEGKTALASATVVFISPHSLHFGKVTTIDQLYLFQKSVEVYYNERMK